MQLICQFIYLLWFLLAVAWILFPLLRVEAVAVEEFGERWEIQGNQRRRM